MNLDDTRLSLTIRGDRELGRAFRKNVRRLVQGRLDLLRRNPNDVWRHHERFQYRGGSLVEIRYWANGSIIRCVVDTFGPPPVVPLAPVGEAEPVGTRLPDRTIYFFFSTYFESYGQTGPAPYGHQGDQEANTSDPDNNGVPWTKSTGWQSPNDANGFLLWRNGGQIRVFQRPEWDNLPSLPAPPYLYDDFELYATTQPHSRPSGPLGGTVACGGELFMTTGPGGGDGLPGLTYICNHLWEAWMEGPYDIYQGRTTLGVDRRARHAYSIFTDPDPETQFRGYQQMDLRGHHAFNDWRDGSLPGSGWPNEILPDPEFDPWPSTAPSPWQMIDGGLLPDRGMDLEVISDSIDLYKRTVTRVIDGVTRTFEIRARLTGGSDWGWSDLGLPTASYTGLEVKPGATYQSERFVDSTGGNQITVTGNKMPGITGSNTQWAAYNCVDITPGAEDP